MNTKLNIEYCNQYCQKGIEARNKFLDKNNSVFDAAIDFWVFIDSCFKTCPYRDNHVKETK